MEIPAFLWGSYAQVKPKARRFVKAFAVGEHARMLTATLDTATTPGSIVIDTAFSSHKKEEAFHLYTILECAVVPPRPDESLLRLCSELMNLAPWGPLALMGQNIGFIPYTEALRTKYLRAVLRWWSVYKEEGARYAGIGLVVGPLWSVGPRFKSDLAHRGIPNDMLAFAPLPNDDLRALMALHYDLFRDVLSEGDDSIDSKDE